MLSHIEPRDVAVNFDGPTYRILQRSLMVVINRTLEENCEKA